MGLAERYLFWRAIKALALTTGGFVVVTTLSNAEVAFGLYGRRAIDLGELLYLMLLWVPAITYLVMPLAAGLAIGGAYALAIQDREIAALNAAGASCRRLVLPGVLAALAAALLCASMSLYLVPVSFLEFSQRSFLAARSVGPQALHENRFNEVEPGVELYFERRLAGGTVSNVVVFLREGDAVTAITAKLGHVMQAEGRIRIVLHEGYVIRGPADAEPGAETGAVRFDTYARELAAAPTMEIRRERDRGFFERHISDLFAPPSTETLTPADRASWAAEGYKRVIHPLLCLAYALAALTLVLGAGHERRQSPTTLLLRVSGILVALHPAFLVGMGVLAKAPEADPRIALIVPVALAAASLYVLARLDGRRRGPAIPGRGAGRALS